MQDDPDPFSMWRTRQRTASPYVDADPSAYERGSQRAPEPDDLDELISRFQAMTPEPTLPAARSSADPQLRTVVTVLTLAAGIGLALGLAYILIAAWPFVLVGLFIVAVIWLLSGHDR
jgi:hypothetical protein